MDVSKESCGFEWSVRAASQGSMPKRGASLGVHVTLRYPAGRLEVAPASCAAIRVSRVGLSLKVLGSLGCSDDSETKDREFIGSGRALFAGGGWRLDSVGSFIRAIVSVTIRLGSHFSIIVSMSTILEEGMELHGDLSGGSLKMGCGIAEGMGVEALLSLLKLGDITIGTLLDMPHGTQKTK